MSSLLRRAESASFLTPSEMGEIFGRQHRQVDVWVDAWGIHGRQIGEQINCSEDGWRIIGKQAGHWTGG